jgi:hypothetical protein
MLLIVATSMGWRRRLVLRVHLILTMFLITIRLRRRWTLRAAPRFVCRQRDQVLRCASPDAAGEALLADAGGRALFGGKIIDVERATREGFARGHVVLEGPTGRLRVDFQNENLVASFGGEVLACVPDLIVLLEAASEPL